MRNYLQMRSKWIKQSSIQTPSILSECDRMGTHRSNRSVALVVRALLTVTILCTVMNGLKHFRHFSRTFEDASAAAIRTAVKERSASPAIKSSLSNPTLAQVNVSACEGRDLCV